MKMRERGKEIEGRGKGRRQSALVVQIKKAYHTT